MSSRCAIWGRAANAQSQRASYRPPCPLSGMLFPLGLTGRDTPVGGPRVQAVRIPALPNGAPVDTTGAGDLFAAGFLSGRLRGLPLEDCCRRGCAAGGAVIRELGGEVGAAGWDWMRAQQAGLLPPQEAQLSAASTSWDC